MFFVEIYDQIYTKYNKKDTNVVSENLLDLETILCKEWEILLRFNQMFNCYEKDIQNILKGDKDKNDLKRDIYDN